MGRWARRSWCGLLAVFFIAPAVAHADTTPQPEVTIRASPGYIVGTHPLVLSGEASDAPAGAVIQLYASPYPYKAQTLIYSAAPAPDGRYSFTASPDRETRYRAVLSGTSASAAVQVNVALHVVVKVRALSLGRASVAIWIFHPRDLVWGKKKVRWWFASGRHGRFAPAQSTLTHRLSPYALFFSTRIALPAGRFSWRACFTAAGHHGFFDRRRPPGCGGWGDYGGGSLPVGFPTPAMIARAEGYLAGRTGHTALAVVDSEGRLSGVHIHDTFITGSVVKAMLLVAYLRRLDRMGQHFVDSYSNSVLYPMINVSDNNAATQCWSIVGNSGLYSVAAAAGMTQFSVTTDWGSAILTAADQARFFFEMDSLIPHEFVGYARYLLSTIAAYESWGIPAIARPLGYTVFFKGGWRPSPDIYLVHQIARLEGHRHTFAMAVMTDGDPDMGYGIGTIQGTTAALLR